jgi:nicotinamide mononucleotide transporter
MLFEAFLWIFDRSLEIIATIAGLLYIIYSVERNIMLWPYGIVSSAIFVYVCFRAGIYADMGLYVYYVIIGFYGWYHWHQGVSNSNGGVNLPVIKTTLKQGCWLFLLTLAIYFILLYILKHYTNSNIPYWDSFTTAVSITATWMLTQKMMEQWILWIIVDSITIGLYFYKGLYPAITLYLVYTILSFTGYLEWNKEWKAQPA